MAIAKLKSVFSTGAWINNVKSFFTKINEIIDHLNGNGATGSGSYKKYVASLNQSGTNAPVPTILENTLGNLAWSYDSVGYYLATLTGAFVNADKVVVFISHQYFARETGGLIITKEVTADRYDDNSIFVATAEFDAVSSGNVLQNAVLVNTVIEIRVYN